MRDPKSLRIVFMGTPEFAVASLDQLVTRGYNVVGVITAPDKPAGRGQQLQESDVKKYAVSKGLHILQPEKLKDPEFLATLKALQADLQIVVAFRMLPEAVWQMPPLGTFNLHGSLLPRYRGAAPIHRAVMNGEKETGVTTFFLKHDIDTGNIIFRESTPIGEEETTGIIYDRLMHIGAALVCKTVDHIAAGDIVLQEQAAFIKEGEVLPHAPKIFRDDCRINWSNTGKAIHNHVRGLNPFPAAWTELHSADGKITQVKIYRVAYETGMQHKKPGTLGEQLTAACGDGTIIIKELQVAGKKRMSAEEFLRGYRLQPGETMV